MTQRQSRLALACMVALFPTGSIAQDRALVIPGMKVLVNNDCVRVQYHDVGVGKTAPMHSHPAYVVYTLRPFKALITLPDGTQRISEHKAGEAYWNAPISHSVKNLGAGPIHNLIVEMKSGGNCPALGAGAQSSHLDELTIPGMKVLLENDCVRVRRHDFAVGQSVPLHAHQAYVGYPLNSFNALITLADGTKMMTARKAGEAYWSPPVVHAVQNVGKVPIHALIFEIKPGGECQ